MFYVIFFISVTSPLALSQSYECNVMVQYNASVNTYPHPTQIERCLHDHCNGILNSEFIDQSWFVKTDGAGFYSKFLWKTTYFKNLTGCSFAIKNWLTNRREYLCLGDSAVTGSTLFYACINNISFGQSFKAEVKPLDSNTSSRSITGAETPYLICGIEEVQRTDFCYHIELNISKYIDCEGRKFELSYDILNLKQVVLFQLRFTINGEIVKAFDLPHSSGRINLTFPEDQYYNKSYVIFVLSKTFVANQSYTKMLNVTNMVEKCVPKGSLSAKQLALVCGFVFALFFVLVVCFVTKCDLTLMLSWIEKNKMLKSSPSLYLLFVNDSPMHKDVALKFASFLHHYLGYKVLCELYDRQNFIRDPVAWVESALSDAFKVIFVWSPGATKRWRSIDTKKYRNDMFSVVLKRARKDISERKQKKYIFINFDYCLEDISFLSKPVQCYQLMPECYDLCVHLKQANSCFSRSLGIKTNSDLLCKSQYGAVLSNSILSMQKYTQEHPNWAEDDEARNSEATL